MLTFKMTDIVMEYAERALFSIKSQCIYSNDKIGIIGTNGSGKTTLLEIIAGKLKPSSGKCLRYTDLSYIEQLGYGDVGSTCSIDYSWSLPTEPKSGGEIMRQKIAQALGANPGMLLCDEPTSNLDEQGIMQLEKTLIGFKGALVLVSHDRRLLDSVCTKIWEIDGAVKEYSGNYSDYINEKNKQLQNQQKEYDKYVDKKNRLQSAVNNRARKSASMKNPPKRMGNSEARLHRMDVRQKAGKVSKASAQIKSRLEKLEDKQKPEQPIIYKLASIGDFEKAGKIAITVENLSYSYGENRVLRNTSFVVSNGEKVCITGANGSGKTTLLNCIANRVEGVKISPSMQIGYFRQDCVDLDDNDTIIDYVLRQSAQPEHITRSIIAGLGIKRDEVYKKIKILSGGERCKVSLSKLICQNPSILLLDEPTNYLDIYILSALEKMLQSYEGTLILVSHDRHFRNETTQREISFS